MKIFTTPTHSFVCTHENTRNGFRHVCVVYDLALDREIFRSKVTYINRTWESFEFETVLNKAKALLEKEVKK